MITEDRTGAGKMMWKRWWYAISRFFLIREDESAEAMAPLSKHIENMRAFARSVPPRNALVFAVAAAERQFLLFVCFCEPRHRQASEVARQTLDALWAWVRDSTPLSASVATNLVALFPRDVENDTWPHGYALEYLCSLELLLQATEHYDAEAVVSIANDATNGIDYVLQEVSTVPLDSPAWFTQELFVAELTRQREDQAWLHNPLKTQLVDELRQRSQGVSITGELAFSPEEA